MTKKILLKWLEEQKVKALAQVDTQENAEGRIARRKTRAHEVCRDGRIR